MFGRSEEERRESWRIGEKRIGRESKCVCVDECVCVGRNKEGARAERLMTAVFRDSVGAGRSPSRIVQQQENKVKLYM